MSLPFLLSTGLSFALLLGGCQSSNSNPNKPLQNLRTTPWRDNSITATAQNKDSSALRMYFDNSNGAATLLIDGKIIELKGQKPAAGIWYANAQY